MKVYRIVTPRWCDTLTGSGRPARWNEAGEFVLYTSESRSLACLECMVHRNSAQLRGLFRIMIIDISANTPVVSLPLDLLSPIWVRTDPAALAHCRNTIHHFIKDLPSSTKIIKVPSAVVPGEFNLLLYTRSGELDRLKIHAVEPFMVDGRL